MGTWAAAPTGPIDRSIAAAFVPSITLDNATLRMVVRSSVAGGKVRVRFSNEIGETPAALRIGAAHIALRDKGSAIVSATDRALTFGGRSGVVIPPKGYVVSDPVDLVVPALTDLSVSIFLPDRSVVQSGHFITRQAQYVYAGGDATAAPSLPASATTGPNWFVLTGVDVVPKASNASALVALGDSITDGFGQSSVRIDAPTPWPSWPSRLAERLQASPSLAALAVLNEGISGNRLLNDAAQTAPPTDAGLRAFSIYGPSAVSRFDRDVAGQSGASCVLVLLGINDLGQGSQRNQTVSADQVIAGHRQIIAKARAANLKVLGATLTPFQGYAGAGYYSPENEAKRQAVNGWIRQGGQYDAVVDFDAMVRDAANPAVIRADHDSGDHLHPSDVAYKAMADGIDLDTVQRLCVKH